MAEKILVIGACGQIGTELVDELRNRFGNSQVVATDIREGSQFESDGPFEELDTLDIDALRSLIERYEITQVYQMAALLSATAEQKPEFAWRLNMEGLFNVLNLAKDKLISKVFWPSSIAVFGPSTPSNATPQCTIMDPNTVYGISKLAGERWCEYYHLKHGVDVRSIRYPGLISYKSPPGGGTTDYAVEIFHKALEEGRYTSFLSSNTTLPMMYMPDAISATINIMATKQEQIRVRSSYNIAAFSFNPEELAEAIREYVPNFEISYQPDFREQIAKGWPESINDDVARADWGWENCYNIDQMCQDMITHLKKFKNKQPSA